MHASVGKLVEVLDGLAAALGEVAHRGGVAYLETGLDGVEVESFQIPEGGLQLSTGFSGREVFGRCRESGLRNVFEVFDRDSMIPGTGGAFFVSITVADLATDDRPEHRVVRVDLFAVPIPPPQSHPDIRKSHAVLQLPPPRLLLHQFEDPQDEG
ncbi:MAG: hypothetical protein AB7I30_01695 [Isosphaeraceae bacterium]